VLLVSWWVKRAVIEAQRSRRLTDPDRWSIRGTRPASSAAKVVIIGITVSADSEPTESSSGRRAAATPSSTVAEESTEANDDRT
jgi:hypothetical protein